MVRFKFTAKLAAPADVYFVERDTDQFRSLQSKLMKLGELRIVDESRHSSKHVVTLATMPNIGKYIPGGVLKRFGLEDLRFEDVLLYEEEHVQGPEYCISFTSIPPVAAEKVRIEGRLTIRPIDKHHCLQTLEGNADIRVFGLRSLVEPVLVESLSRSYKQLPKVVEEWMFRREEILMEQGLEGLLQGRPDMSWLPNDVERQEKCFSYRQCVDPGSLLPASFVAPDAGPLRLEAGHDGPSSSPSSNCMDITGGVPDLIDMHCITGSTDMFSDMDEMGMNATSPFGPLSMYPHNEDYLSGERRHSIRSPVSTDGDASMHSAISSFHSISTKASVKSKRRALAKAQRSGWCGLGMPYPIRGNYESERLAGIEDDEIIRKRSSRVLVDIGNQNTFASSNVNATDRVLVEDDGDVLWSKKQMWLFCGVPASRSQRKSENGSFKSSSTAPCTTDTSKYCSTSLSDKRGTQVRQGSRKKKSISNTRNNFRCWVICGAPQPLD